MPNFETQPSSEQIRKAWTYMTLAQEKMAAVTEDCCRDVLCRVDTSDTDRFALYSWPEFEDRFIHQIVIILDIQTDLFYIYKDGIFLHTAPNNEKSCVCLKEHRIPPCE